MDEENLLRVVQALETEGIEAWIDGGWGVDALLGHRVREHDDLDLVVELRHADRVIDVLRALGYELAAGAPPKSFVHVDAIGRQVDVHPVTFAAEGGGVYETEEGTWTYPAGGFRGVGRVAGRTVRCLTAEVQVLVHSGYELSEKDYLELCLLREWFGVDVPGDLLDDVLAAGARLRGKGGV
jgi:lincosamide nucleotidyltransferase A/C/D/E